MNKNIAYQTDQLARYFTHHRISYPQFYESEHNIINQLALGANDSILDIGCGCGGSGLALRDEFGVQKYSGVEINSLAAGNAVNELQIYTPDPSACAPSSEDFSGNVYGHGHVKIYEEIIEHFNDVKKFPVTFEDTLATIQLLNSFYLADETQCWVDVATAGDSARLGELDNELADLYRTNSSDQLSDIKKC